MERLSNNFDFLCEFSKAKLNKTRKSLILSVTRSQLYSLIECVFNAQFYRSELTKQEKQAIDSKPEVTLKLKQLLVTSSNECV